VRIGPSDTLGCVEAHGTGTSRGDLIERAALTEAYRTYTARQGCCAVGSVKTNIGHLDAGSCAIGLIKTVLAMIHNEIPPSLNLEKPEPHDASLRRATRSRGQATRGPAASRTGNPHGSRQPAAV
jgi:acyl transferase domain-containing protein